MSSSDAKFLRRAIEGDADALAQLLALHGPQVERTLRIDARWCAHLDPADVMQVTYLEAFRHIREFDLTRANRFETWLRQLAENNLRDAVRGLARQKRGRRDGRVTGEAADLALAQVGLSDTPSRVMRRADRALSLEAAIARLPSDYAQVIRLVDLEGRSVAEVALAMKRSAGAIHMLRARAQDRLRELLGPASEFISKA